MYALTFTGCPDCAPDAPSKPNLTVGSYTYGSSLTLRCNKARPEDHSRLTYTFYVDGEVVKETWKDNMVINKFTNQFAGVYSCDVTADGARSVMSDPAVVAELATAKPALTTPTTPMERAQATQRESGRLFAQSAVLEDDAAWLQPSLPCLILALSVAVFAIASHRFL
ncbi:hypothetical protein BaRGS_00028147 [Batillaria attramentaria]|uniref:Ig-like domain-containing protein n=1 Tax=Batillaria attramentaria TaxID=370345 RepID=A0ABD0K0Z4_9CAEN